MTQYGGGQLCCPREVTEIHVVILLEFGPAEAHAFGHKSGNSEMTNGSKLFSSMAQQPVVCQGLLVVEDLPRGAVKSLPRPWMETCYSDKYL